MFLRPRNIGNLEIDYSIVREGTASGVHGVQRHQSLVISSVDLDSMTFVGK